MHPWDKLSKKQQQAFLTRVEQIERRYDRWLAAQARMVKEADHADAILRKLMPWLLAGILIVGLIAISVASMIEPILLFSAVPILLLLVGVFFLIVLCIRRDGNS